MEGGSVRHEEVGFEPMTPVFERANTVHAYRAANVIGEQYISILPVLNNIPNNINTFLPHP
jgi:hypothetical protein